MPDVLAGPHLVANVKAALLTTDDYIKLERSRPMAVLNDSDNDLMKITIITTITMTIIIITTTIIMRNRPRALQYYNTFVFMRRSDAVTHVHATAELVDGSCYSS